MGAISEVPGVSSRTSSSTSSITTQKTDQWIRLFMMFVCSSIALVVYMVITDYKSIQFRHSRDYTPQFKIPGQAGAFNVPDVDASNIHSSPNTNMSYRLEYNKLTDHNDESKIEVRHSLSVTPLRKNVGKIVEKHAFIENSLKMVEKDGKVEKIENTEIEQVIENTLEDPAFEKIEAHPDDDKIRFYVDPSEASVADSQLEATDSLITWTCPFDYPEDFSELSKIMPEFNLRKDKFLINVSPFGPNNQFRGFRDTIMLAYYLNRTIALPGFFKHGTDPSVDRANFSSNFQPAREKVDAFELAKFIPTITFEQFGKECQGGMDFTLFARSAFGGGPYNQLIEYENRLGINMTKKQTLPSFLRKPKISNITVWPTKDGINNLDDNKVGKQLFLQMNEAAVDKAYGNKITKDGKCGMWFMPFRNIYWARAVLGRFGKVKADLAKKLVLATPRPKSIRLTAEQFRRQEMKNKSYVAIHWRYDMADFGNHCRSAVGPGNRKACDYILKNGFNATDIGSNVATFIKTKNIKADAIFIAAPPKETNFIRKLSEYLSNNHGIQVFFQEDLRAFLESSYSGCDKKAYFNQIHDFVSQLEQEICMGAKVFMPSDGSSWSVAITMERAARDIVVNDVANSVMLR